MRPDPAIAALTPDAFKDGIRAVTSAPYPPFEVLGSDGTLSGLDIDLGNALAVKLGVPIRWESIEFDGIIPAVQAGKYDLILAAMGDTADRERALDFVDFASQYYVLVVPKGNPAGLTRLADLCGRTLATEAGNHKKDYFDAVQSECTRQGKPPMRVSELPKAADAVQAVTRGDADAEYLGVSSALALVASVDNGRALEIVAPDGGWDPHNAGVGLPKGVPGWTQAVLAAMTALADDGTLAAIFAKYGGTDTMLPAPVLNSPLTKPLTP